MITWTTAAKRSQAAAHKVAQKNAELEARVEGLLEEITNFRHSVTNQRLQMNLLHDGIVLRDRVISQAADLMREADWDDGGYFTAVVKLLEQKL